MQSYKAFINDKWVLLQNHYIISSYDSEEELNQFLQSNSIDPYLILESQNFLKIGNAYFSKNDVRIFKEGKFKYKIQTDMWQLRSENGHLMMKFESEELFKNWRIQFDEWWYAVRKKDNRREEVIEKEADILNKSKMKLKNVRSRGYKRKVKPLVRSNFVSTEAFRRMKQDPDWFREQT